MLEYEAFVNDSLSIECPAGKSHFQNFTTIALSAPDNAVLRAFEHRQ